MFEIFVTGHYSSLVGKFGDSFGGVANVSCHCMHTKTQLAPSVRSPLFLFFAVASLNRKTYLVLPRKNYNLLFRNVSNKTPKFEVPNLDKFELT